MKTKKLLFRSAGLLVIAFIIVAFCIPFVGCDSYKASTYTVEEHIQRVSERVEKRYIKNGGEYTGYKVYPLYNENDELAYFLVDFEPQGYLYVKLNEKSSPFGASMYSRSATEGEGWRRFKIEMGNDEYWVDGKGYEHAMGNIRFIPDENGEIVDYYDSQFKVANIVDEKRYLLEITQNGEDGYIPAVKRGDKYLNLVSMEEFDYEKEIDTLKNADIGLYFLKKTALDL